MITRILLITALLVVGSCDDHRLLADAPAQSAPAMHTLADEFSGSAVQRQRWNFYKDSTRTELDDRLVVTLMPDSAGYGGLISATPHSFVGTSLVAEVSQVAEGGRYTETFIGVTTLDEEEYVVISSLNAKIGAYFKWRGKRWREVGSIDFDAEQHRFRRIREQNGTIFYELSADGTDWHHPRGWQVASKFTDINALHAAVGAGAYEADPAPGIAVIQSVNTIGSGQTRVASTVGSTSDR